MFTRILFPVDLQSAESEAERCVSDLAGSKGSTVLLLHVIQTIQDASYEEFKSFYEELEEKAKKKLEVAATRLQHNGVVCETQIVFGDRVKEIVTAASDSSVDLLVLQSHVVNLEQPTEGWDTISYQVSVLSPCAVLLVK